MITLFRTASSNQEPADGAELQARRWVVLNFSDDRSAEQEAAFKRWLASDPKHRAAYEQAESVWLGIGYLSHLRGHARLEDLNRFTVSSPPVHSLHAARKRWLGGAGLLAGAAAALAVLVVVVLPFLAGQQADIPDRVATGIAEVREIELPDGSMVTLGARTEMSFEFSGRARRVSLESGEAFFEIAKDPQRSFFVSAGTATVRVVGTAFEVRRSTERVTISVAEGVVDAVIGEEWADDSLTSGHLSRLQASQQLVARSDGSVEAMRPVSPALLAPWREGRLYYDNASLKEILFDIARYYRGRIRLADEELGELRITGSYRIDRIEDMILQMEDILPLRVERLAPDHLVLHKRKTGTG